MANSGDPSTFTFTIDCFPAYTKFNKTKKVLATLQVLDPTDTKHNYANKDVIGHDERSADDDAYFTGLYNKSVFDQVAESAEGGDTPTPEPTPTYTQVTPEGTENPSELGWYEEVDGEYVETTDTTVDSDKTYYERA